MNELQTVKFIGPKTEKKLIEKGITSITQLSGMSPDELLSVINEDNINPINPHQSVEIIHSAKEITLADSSFLSFEDIQEYQQKIQMKISTGSPQVDNILGGGVKTDSTTMISGSASSGKTQICFQLMVNCLKDLNRKVVYIETEPSIFSHTRFLEICNHADYEIDKKDDLVIFPHRLVFDVDTQYNAYQKTEDVIKQGKDIGMICIDSFTSLFRGKYRKREQYPDRSSEFSRHMSYLELLASRYNIAIVMTDQVMQVPDVGGQYSNLAKFGDVVRPYGGAYLLHCPTLWLNVKQKSKQGYDLTCIDSSEFAKQNASFTINEKGIRDI